MLKQPVYINALASVSPLGSMATEIWNAYKSPASVLQLTSDNEARIMVGKLPVKVQAEITQLRNSKPAYQHLDNSVLYAVYAAEKALAQTTWGTDSDIGVNIGSSRGATALFEQYHEGFLATKNAETLSSPTTTLGNIASWVAQAIKAKGPVISHSITCSTALHALLNGVAWLQSGMAQQFLVGGSEAALTPFTIAQMQALKIYSKETDAYPCRALDLSKTKNTMVLGEGAAVAGISLTNENALATIVGIGYATEMLAHNISISSNALCFQDAMRMAIGDIPLGEIDAIVLHAPGTKKGDTAEVAAIQAVFWEYTPALTTNKWKIGHTFGASGMLSLELAVLMLQHQEFIPVPFIDNPNVPKKLRTILVNAVGFGGNAVSILVQR